MNSDWIGYGANGNAGKSSRGGGGGGGIGIFRRACGGTLPGFSRAGRPRCCSGGGLSADDVTGMG
jgi:hypothetical protein